MLQKTGALMARNQKFLPLTATIVLFFVTYVAGAYFLPAMRDPQVFFNLFRASPFLLISAVGMTLVIISGGIDLSVSGIIALTTVASAALLRDAGWDPWMVMLLMLGMGVAFGAVMGFFITYLKVQPFIATLAGMWFARGMCYFISDDAIPINNRIFRILGQTRLLIPGLSDPVTQTGDYISILVVVAILIFGVGIYLAHFTRFGRTVYAMGGNEGSARLMGLSVNRTKMLVYTFNGLCSTLAGLAYTIYVMSGHGSYAKGFEMTVIAAVVIGGTVLTGGEGYVFGTLFGALITVLIQTLILFNGRLSSWWTSIVIGVLMLIFIGVQSLLAARNARRLASEKMKSQAKAPHAARQKGAVPGAWLQQNRRLLLVSGLIVLVILIVPVVNATRNSARGSISDTPAASPSVSCQLKPFRHDQAEALMASGAVIAYERNGGSTCLDELYGIFPDGRIIGDNGAQQIEKQASPEEIEQLLIDIRDKGWFTEEMYTTTHTPCGQCFSYYLTVQHGGQVKTVQAVDGGTDAPANYWQVVSRINGITPKFEANP